MSEPALHVSGDPAGAVGELLAEAARRGEAIVLTGGSTPGKAYEHAAALEPDWSEASVWWGDERCVPPDDERSNYGLAKRTLLDRLEREPDVHRIRGELQPADAAGEYDKQLEGVELDFLLLGLGPDGHVASLFPGSPQLEERERRVTSGPAGLEPWVDRVTMTLPTLLSARRIVFLVSGESKAGAVRRAFQDEVTEEVPASLLRGGQAPIEVYLDPAAAAELEVARACSRRSRRRLLPDQRRGSEAIRERVRSRVEPQRFAQSAHVDRGQEPARRVHRRRHHHLQRHVGEERQVDLDRERRLRDRLHPPSGKTDCGARGRKRRRQMGLVPSRATASIPVRNNTSVHADGTVGFHG